MAQRHGGALKEPGWYVRYRKTQQALRNQRMDLLAKQRMQMAMTKMRNGATVALLVGSATLSAAFAITHASSEEKDLPSEQLQHQQQPQGSSSSDDSLMLRNEQENFGEEDVVPDASQQGRDDVISIGHFSMKVMRNKRLGPNTRLVRLALNDESHSLDYTVGSFVTIKGTSMKVDEFFPFGKNVEARYLPVHSPEKKGHLDLIVKEFPYPAGSTSRYIASSRKGDRLEVIVPVSRFKDSDLEGCKNFAVIAGGSGLTAAIQLVRKKLASPKAHEDGVRIAVVASDRTLEDMFYVQELEALAERHPDKLSIFRTLTRESSATLDAAKERKRRFFLFELMGWVDNPAGNVRGRGRISKEMLEENLGDALQDPEAKFIVCGGTPFVEHLVGTSMGPPNAPESPRISGDDAKVGGLLAKLGLCNPEQILVL